MRGSGARSDAAVSPVDLELRSGVDSRVAVRAEVLDGREVVVARFDGAAPMLAEDGAALAVAATTACRQRLPLAVFVSSSGPSVEGGAGALSAWGTAARQLTACSGVVPVIFVVAGPAVSGAALLVGLADVAIFTEDAYAFVSRPQAVTEMTGVVVSTGELGGTDAHFRRSGVAALVAADGAEAEALLADVLGYLPDSVDDLPARRPTDDPPDRPTPEAGAVLPPSPSGGYDVRDLLRCVVDDGEILELRAGFAPNLVTALAAMDGRPVGIVANQPIAVAGTLDIEASQKGGRFVAFCDAFNLPVVTVVDTPGFYPGKDLEWRGMIRHGAQMAFAYARASVPRIALVVRKSYGGAYIVMDSKRMGNDLAVAWPSAEIAVMGASQAAEVLHRRESPERRVELEAEYETRYLNPYVAAERGLIDGVIEPADTRAVLAAAVGALADRRERLPARRHDNSPL